MLEKLKLFWNKIRLGVILAIAGVVFAFLVFKKHLGDGFGQYLSDEANARDMAKKKFEEGNARLEAEKQADLKKVDQEEKKELKEADKKADDTKKELTQLEKKNEDAFKDEVDKQLGVKEKKKGKRKKNA
jgi:hypothetical protein